MSFDGEEEIGSPSIDKFVTEHLDLLKADAGMSLDGGFEASNRPRIQFGSSGLLYIEVNTRGSTQGDLHSARARLVESAAWKAIWIAASMKDQEENILIEGFSDTVTGPTAEERKMLEETGWDDAKQLEELGVERFLTGVTSALGPPNWKGHAPNEFITIGHFLDGIKYVAMIYANYAAVR